MNSIYIESSLSGKSRGELIEIIENQHKRIKELERLSESDALTGLLHKKAAVPFGTAVFVALVPKKWQLGTVKYTKMKKLLTLFCVFGTIKNGKGNDQRL